jgi:hypothetical protein
MDNIQIPITENGTVTLATAGKYCDRNIDVNVDVAGSSGDSYYDEFWDIYQDGGNRTYYQYGFCGAGWNKNNFNPKYPIKIVGSGESSFRRFNHGNYFASKMADLSQFNIDWSECTSLNYAFRSARIGDTGLIDATGCTALTNTFENEGGGAIYKITLKVNKGLTYTKAFVNQANLTDLIFTEDSEIGNSGIDLSASTLLSKASFQNIISALSSTTSGKSITFSKTAKANAFTDEEWSALVATKSNWTINLG